MATIKIGDRNLDVREATIGFWKRFRAFSATADKLDNEAAVDKIVAMFLELVGHNEGVTAEWLEDRLPMRAALLNAQFSAMLTAGGLVAKEQPPAGEPAAQ